MSFFYHISGWRKPDFESTELSERPPACARGKPAARALAQQAANNGNSQSAAELAHVEATEEDVEVAMEGLAPASLQGVKLTSVEGSAKTWKDVGMKEVEVTSTRRKREESAMRTV